MAINYCYVIIYQNKTTRFFFYRVCYTTLYILGITGIDEMKIPTKNNHDFDDGPVILGILYIQDYPTL